MTPPTRPQFQPDLLDPLPTAAPAQRLSIAPQGAVPLGKEQATFNRLIRQVESLRGKLAEWAAFEHRYRQRVISQFVPLQQQLVQGRRDVILLLQEILAGNAGGGVSGKAERKRLVNYLLELASVHLGEDPGDAAVIELYDRYADFSFAEDQASNRDMARADMQEMFGVELDDDLDAGTMEEMLAAGMARMQQQAEQEAQAREQAKADRSARRKQGGKAQQRDAEKAAAAEQAAHDVSQSVREIYRKLASALHPDRAADETDRARRNECMQRVNQAYDKSDLLTLLSVQLEIEQIDTGHLARVSKARLGHYNKVLREQVKELESELAAIEDRYCMLLGGFSFSATPAAVEQRMASDIRTVKKQIKAIAEHRALLLQPQARRDWLKAEEDARRQERRMASLMQDILDGTDPDFDDGMFDPFSPPKGRPASTGRGRNRRR